MRYIPPYVPPGDWNQSHYSLRDRLEPAARLPKVTGHQTLARPECDGKEMRQNRAPSSGHSMDAGA